MSNLNLPLMTFDSLERTLNHDGTIKTIAYATTAELIPAFAGVDAYVSIRHHGTEIAKIARNWVDVTNAGYTSQTTRDRIHKILHSNGNVGVSQRNHVQTLIHNLRGERTHSALPDFYSISLVTDGQDAPMRLLTFTGIN